MRAAGAALLAGLVVLGAAFALPVQRLGCGQKSHLSLVRALADGTPVIDRWSRETCDISFSDGHYYANKAPGLAFATLPVYLALEALGLLPADDRDVAWLLGLFGAVLPSLLLVALVWWAARRLDRGTELVVAGVLALGTLVLPFSGIFVSHPLTALLGFAAFALLLRERAGPGDARLVAAAGLLAGLAVVVEYPTALVAVAVGVYATLRPRHVRRALAYGGGLVVGVLPLLAYDTWAFGSPFTLSYAGDSAVPGQSETVVAGPHDEGFYGVLLPSLSALVRILLSDRGLLVLMPVLAACAVGLVLLYRSGWRAEAALAGGLTAAFLVYNASLTEPDSSFVYGGDVPAARFVFASLPFLCLGAGVFARRLPATLGALWLVSAAVMTLATATNTQIGTGQTGEWIDRVQAREFASTALDFAGAGTGWLGILPFLLAVAASFAIAATQLVDPLRERRDWSVAATAVGAWALVAVAGRHVVSDTGLAAAIAGLLLLAAAVSLVALEAHRRRPGQAVPA